MDPDDFASETSTEDLVPTGYWERLGAAMDACTPLPTQDRSQDPEVLV